MINHLQVYTNIEFDRVWSNFILTAEKRRHMVMPAKSCAGNARQRRHRVDLEKWQTSTMRQLEASRHR